MNRAEKEHMDSLINAPQVRCVGRFLIDIPGQPVLSPDGGQEVDGVRLVVISMREEKFKEILSGKKAELEKKTLPGEERYPYLRYTKALPDGIVGVIFDRATSDVAASRMGRVLELIAWRGGYSVTASIDAIDTDFPEFANDSWIKESKTTIKEQSAVLLGVASRVRGRKETEIPAENGFCISNGFVSGNASAIENVTMTYFLKSAPDVFLTLNTNSSYGRSDSLLDRGRRAQEVIAEGNGAILRMGRHAIGGAKDGEELLYRILSDPDAERKRIMTYKFAFEANNKAGNAVAPLLAIDLDIGEIRTGDGAPIENLGSVLLKAATLTEPEAIALWDAVIPTVRPRVGAF